MNSETQSFKPDIYVIARIIKALKEKKSMNRTALSISTGLAYDKLVKYLAWMSKKGFVVVDEKGLVVLTETGLKTYDELVQWIIRYIGQLKFPRLHPRT
ncbi:MAG: winged helix-turn-helix domain-containing protein [Candidatus Bathyarchaeota archaeon]|nr:winged helix-turn-helix domain-containing protein [Candidatus Bathyarchaeota archaeon]